MLNDVIIEQKMAQQRYTNEYHPDERSEEERNAQTQMASNGFVDQLSVVKDVLNKLRSDYCERETEKRAYP